MNKNIIIGAVVVVGGLFVLSNIFGQKDESGTELADEEASADEMQVVLPSDMPSVPMYPDSVLKKVSESEDETARNITLTLSAQSSVADVNTWYRGALNENGWTVVSDQNVSGYILLKGENQDISVFTQAANGNEAGEVIITERVKIDKN